MCINRSTLHNYYLKCDMVKNFGIQTKQNQIKFLYSELGTLAVSEGGASGGRTCVWFFMPQSLNCQSFSLALLAIPFKPNFNRNRANTCSK